MFNIQKMMKQAQQMQQKIKDAQEELKRKEFEGVAGGGVVKVVLMGDYKMKSVNIDNSLLSSSDEKDMLEDLIVTATNDAIKKISDESSSMMSDATGGLKLPDGMGF